MASRRASLAEARGLCTGRGAALPGQAPQEPPLVERQRQQCARCRCAFSLHHRVLVHQIQPALCSSSEPGAAAAAAPVARAQAVARRAHRSRLQRQRSRRRCAAGARRRAPGSVSGTKAPTASVIAALRPPAPRTPTPRPRPPCRARLLGPPAPADQWGQKAIRRKTTGSGRMRYMKDLPRRFKNGFREGERPAAIGEGACG